MTLSLINAPSPNFNDRQHRLDMLVLHYTGMKDGPTALARMQDPKAEVSAHYMVEEDGRVFVLVAEDKRAWHAGRSAWRGDEDLNSRSIGIEIVNGGHEFGLPPFPDSQIAAVIELCCGILSRWPIPPARIVAHSDIAPDRKDDPGERFPWRVLAAAGVGFWPENLESEDAMHAGLRVGLRVGEQGELVQRLQAKLRTIGYQIDPTGRYDVATEIVVRAFQRRWRPTSLSGQADLATVMLVEAVARLAG